MSLIKIPDELVAIRLSEGTAAKICRFAATQPVGVSKYFGRAEYVEHPHGRQGDDRDASQSLSDNIAGVSVHFFRCLACWFTGNLVQKSE